jgi:drug/metabolite transporter (DMT)-like permease
MKPSYTLLILIAASIMWGLSWLPLKALNQLGIEGIPLTFIAYGAITVLLLPLMIIQRERWRGEGRWLLLIAVLGGYANIAFTCAMIYGEVVRVMVLFYLLPVWGVLGGRVFFGEHIDAARAIAVAIALLGAFLVLGGFSAFDGSISWSDGLALSASMTFAANNLAFRARQSAPVPIKVAAMLIGCFVIASVLVMAQIQAWPESASTNWIYVALFGIGFVLVATTGTQWGVTHMEAGRASIIIILELITAIISAMLIAGETMSTMEWTGGLMILSAAIIEARRNEPASEINLSQA